MLRSQKFSEQDFYYKYIYLYILWDILDILRYTGTWKLQNRNWLSWIKMDAIEELKLQNFHGAPDYPILYKVTWRFSTLPVCLSCRFQLPSTKKLRCEHYTIVNWYYGNYKPHQLIIYSLLHNCNSGKRVLDNRISDIYYVNLTI